MTLTFESCLLLLEIFKVEVLEILWQLALYMTIDRLETTIHTNKLNRTANIGLSTI
jgi:hypothetical protein